jgi:nicotinamide-nucleotide amidase
VDEEAIAAQGAVSGIVAEQMAVGVRERLGVDWALSITGVAGPDGGTAEKPVGTIYLGLAAPDGTVTSRLYRLSDHFGRDLIRQMSAKQALDLLRLRLM